MTVTSVGKQLFTESLAKNLAVRSLPLQVGSMLFFVAAVIGTLVFSDVVAWRDTRLQRF